jgi:hypothetical protein
MDLGGLSGVDGDVRVELVRWWGFGMLGEYVDLGVPAVHQGIGRAFGLSDDL